LAFIDEVASLSDATPAAVDGSSASAGTGTAASRDDHVHALGPLVANLDFNEYQGLNFIGHNTSDYTTLTQTDGKIVYYTVDSHLYVYIA